MHNISAAVCCSSPKPLEIVKDATIVIIASILIGIQQKLHTPKKIRSTKQALPFCFPPKIIQYGYDSLKTES